MFNRGGPIPILLFADSILGIQPYDWQCQILLHYEAGNQTAAACANFTGKTSTVFPIAALWTLYNFPRARLMYLSATSAQVKKPILRFLKPLPLSAGIHRLDLAGNRSPKSSRRFPLRPRHRHIRQYRRSTRSIRFTSRYPRRRSQIDPRRGPRCARSLSHELPALHELNRSSLRRLLSDLYRQVASLGKCLAFPLPCVLTSTRPQSKPIERTSKTTSFGSSTAPSGFTTTVIR